MSESNIKSAKEEILMNGFGKNPLAEFKAMYEESRNDIEMTITAQDASKYTPAELEIMKEQFKQLHESEYHAMDKYYAAKSSNPTPETPKTMKHSAIPATPKEEETVEVYCAHCRGLMSTTDINGKYVSTCPTCNNTVVINIKK